MKKWNYYNDNDPGVCEWARELIKQGLVPDGEVDCRSITDVQADDVRGFVQCHFFCGILGWSLALRLAGWDDARPVWSGSCPCQPYSSAGKQLGDADARNLWPHMCRLVRECRPVRVFGEQVPGAIGHGWLDGVSADLEAEGYAVGAVVLGAHSVGAPHIRQRLYWVADAERFGVRGGERRGIGIPAEEVSGEVREQRVRPDAGASGHGELADRQIDRRGEGRWGIEERTGSPIHGLDGPVADHDCERFSRRSEPHGIEERPGEPAPRRTDVGGRRGPSAVGDASGERFREARCSVGPEAGAADVLAGSVTAGPWSGILIPCRDGKLRRVPIEPRFQPLAHGVPARVGRLRGYGNAIVPQVAALFIQAAGREA